MKIKVGDNVMVTVGKDRGKSGKVLRVSEKHQRIVVEKINIRTKHIKKSQGNPGQIAKYEASIDVSNVVLLSPKTNKPTRIGYIKLEDGKKQRVCKKYPNEALDTAIKKKVKKQSA
jgi:large subunit ribosomal protein L24